MSGSPQEEASLVEHVGKLVPGAAALTEAGQLCELLVLLGHFEDARVLQRELAKWLSEHKVGSGRSLWIRIRWTCYQLLLPVTRLMFHFVFLLKPVGGHG